jgi:hypothetical protein
MQPGQTLSPNGIFALQKAHAAASLSPFVLAAVSNKKRQERRAIKSVALLLGGFMAY